MLTQTPFGDTSFFRAESQREISSERVQGRVSALGSSRRRSRRLRKDERAAAGKRRHKLLKCRRYLADTSAVSSATIR